MVDSCVSDLMKDALPAENARFGEASLMFFGSCVSCREVVSLTRAKWYWRARVNQQLPSLQIVLKFAGFGAEGSRHEALENFGMQRSHWSGPVDRV